MYRFCTQTIGAIRRASVAGMDLVFPPACPLCGRERDQSGACSACVQEILFPVEELCPACGHEVPRVVYAGRLAPEKHVEMLPDVMAMLLRRGSRKRPKRQRTLCSP